MEKFKKLILSDKILIGISVLCVLLLVLGYSFAWFNTTISGSDVNLNVSSSTKSLTFTDNVAINNSGTPIEPGWGESNNVYKTLVVQNNSSLDQSYNIVFDNLINSFVTTGFLQYRIDCVSGCDATYGTDPNTYVDIPKSLTASDKVIASNIRIKPGAAYKQTYNIYFRYSNSTTVDQSADMGKTLSGYVVIKPVDVVITNLVVNGDFENGTAGWTINPQTSLNSDLSYVTSGSKSMYLNMTSGGWSHRSVNTIVDHKYYVAANILIVSRTSGNIGIRGNNGTTIYNNTQTTTDNSFIKISETFIATNSSFSTWFGGDSPGGTTGYLDDYMVIDLTESFGAGNEPPKEWCDLHLDYFEGTTALRLPWY